MSVDKRKTLKAEFFSRSILYKVSTKRKLARILGIPLPDLRHIVQIAQNGSKTLYRLDAVKGSGRTIEKPLSCLRPLQQKIGDGLKQVEFPDFLKSSKGKRIQDHVSVHLSNDEILCLDVRKYYPSTKLKLVGSFFKKQMRCSPDVSAQLAALTTYDGYLPTGASTSPALSFCSHFKMWLEIEKIVRAHDCRMTLYADDLNISGTSISPSLEWAIERKLRSHSLALNYWKRRMYRSKKRDARIESCGIICDRVNGGLAAPSRIYQMISRDRKELRGQEKDEQTVMRIRGREAWALSLRQYEG